MDGPVVTRGWSSLCLSVVVLYLAIGLSMMYLSTQHLTWDSWKPATCVSSAAGCFCEVPSGGTVLQPVNALSSLAFVISSILVLFCVGYSRRNHVGEIAPSFDPPTSFTLLYSLALALIGFGSAFYHASLTFLGQSLDIAGMYFFVTLVGLIAAKRSLGLKWRLVIWSYVVGNAVILSLVTLLPDLRRYLFALILLLVIVSISSAIGRNKELKKVSHFWAALVLIIVGGLFWVLDVTRILCSPDSVFQGHAIWHVLGAAASYFLFRFLASNVSAFLAEAETRSIIV